MAAAGAKLKNRFSRSDSGIICSGVEFLGGHVPAACGRRVAHERGFGGHRRSFASNAIAPSFMDHGRRNYESARVREVPAEYRGVVLCLKTHTALGSKSSRCIAERRAKKLRTHDGV